MGVDAPLARFVEVGRGPFVCWVSSLVLHYVTSSHGCKTPGKTDVEVGILWSVLASSYIQHEGKGHVVFSYLLHFSLKSTWLKAFHHVVVTVGHLLSIKKRMCEFRWPHIQVLKRPKCFKAVSHLKQTYFNFEIVWEWSLSNSRCRLKISVYYVHLNLRKMKTNQPTN